eukprot:1644054-Amphidinium_carterae.1
MLENSYMPALLTNEEILNYGHWTEDNHKDVTEWKKAHWLRRAKSQPYNLVSVQVLAKQEADVDQKAPCYVMCSRTC